MRILCYSDQIEASPSTLRLAREWAAMTGDSVGLARVGKAGAGTRRAAGEQERHERILPAQPRPDRVDNEAGPDTAFMRILEPAPKPTTATMASIASRASTRMIVVEASVAVSVGGGLRPRFAEKVAVNAHVPTLVVRDAETLRQWLRGERTLRVYCAYEFSATADCALGIVRELQSLAACAVTVGHVARLGEERLRLGIRGSFALDGSDSEVERILERDLRERVDEIMGGGAGVAIDIAGAWGRPDFEIVARAKHARADLLVIGTHQWHGLQRVLHPPSVSRSALRYAPMNLLVVPRSDRQGRHPIRRPRRILVATDFSEAGDTAVRHAYAVAHPDSIVRLVHVVSPRRVQGSEYHKRAMGDRGSKARHADHLSRCANLLCSLVQEDAAVRGIVTEIGVVEHRDPAAAIVQESERFGADMICIGTHERTGLAAAFSRPGAWRILAGSRRPVLVVHPPGP